MTEKYEEKKSQLSKEDMRGRKLELQRELQDISTFLSSIDLSASWMCDSPSSKVKNEDEDKTEEQSGLDDPLLDIQKMLNKAYPISKLTHIKEAVLKGIDEGWFAPYDGKGLTYGRLCKAENNDGISIETVVMTSTGPGHVHPLGEFDLCFALEGEPRFDGFEEGWVVYSPTSWHVPTVTGGRMAILYFLPRGKIQFQREPISSLESRRDILKENKWQSSNI